MAVLYSYVVKSNQKTPGTQQLFDLKKQTIIHTVLLLSVAISSVIFFPFIFDSFIAPKLLTIYVGLTLCLTLLLIYKVRFNQKLNVLPTWVTIPIFVIFACFVLVAAASNFPLTRDLYGQFGRGNGFIYYIAALLVMVLAAITYNESSTFALTKVIQKLSWFFGVYALLQQLGIDIAKLDSKGLSTVILTFGNSNFSGAMLAILFAFAIAKIFGSKRIKFTDFVLPAILLVGVYFTGALQGILIATMAIFTLLPMWIYNQNNSRVLRKVVFAGWIISLFSLILGVIGFGPIAKLFERPSFQMRIEYWKIGIRMIQDNLLLGLGSDRLYNVVPNYMTPRSLELISETRMDNPHNWFIHFGASFGLIPLLAFLSILTILIVQVTLRFRGAPLLHNAQFPLLVMLFAVVIDGLVSIEQPGLGIWMYLLMGCLLGFLTHSKELSRHPKLATPMPKRSAPLVLMLSLMLFFSVAGSVALTSRVINDGILRHHIQKSMSEPFNQMTLQDIVESTLNLKSEPEYVIQSVKPLAKAGDGDALLQISKEFYEYSPNSIQAIAIRAQVLSVVTSIEASCPLQTVLVENTPWGKESVEKYLVCTAAGYSDKNSESNNRSILRYFEFAFGDHLGSGTDLEKILARSIQARLNYNIGKRLEAQKLRDGLLLDLTQLKVREPNQNYKNIDALLAWT